ncbi:AmmeMemoRadiSam system protein B [bacterium]|nr:AmmeMemoRadiSam system protein B [bacterium]RQV98228.1 MAG: AmmeMemoRadiSam system protein B [bacterium]
MSEEIRPSILAGTWYPKNPDKLKHMIQKYLDHVEIPSIKSRIFGLITPHAGYIYSGQTAAYGYKQLLHREIDVVAIFCPMHHYGPGNYVVNGDIAYETPLGDVPVNRNLLNRLKKYVEIEEMFFDQEHAIEIQLPFLQSVLKNFSILPIMVGHNHVNDVEDMVSGLVEILHDQSALLVASSDMHHMNDYDAVKLNDTMVVDALKTYDLTNIRDVLSSSGCSVCGRVPISVVLETAKRLGAMNIQVLSQTNSADVIGSYIPGQYTVGYLSAAVY